MHPPRNFVRALVETRMDLTWCSCMGVAGCAQNVEYALVPVARILGFLGYKLRGWIGRIGTWRQRWWLQGPQTSSRKHQNGNSKKPNDVTKLPMRTYNVDMNSQFLE